MRTGWGRVGGVRATLSHLLVVSCAVVGFPGCSVATMRMPTKERSELGRSRSNCSKIQYPLIDTSVAVIALGSALFSHAQLQGETQTLGDGSQVRSRPEGDDRTFWQVYRGAGYAAAGLFAASAIYGYVTYGRCAALRRDRQNEPESDEPQAETARRTAFPSAVYEFNFRMPLAAAQQACARGGREWRAEPTGGLCTTVAGRRTVPDVRLRYRFGAPYEITVIYGLDPARSVQDYDRLYFSAIDLYGWPQVDRVPLKGDCAKSLSECLAAGERPKGASWHWSSGAVELAPVHRDGRALLEMRYTYEPTTVP